MNRTLRFIGYSLTASIAGYGLLYYMLTENIIVYQIIFMSNLVSIWVFALIIALFGELKEE